MKFNYKVKHNGVIYPAGAEVPVGVVNTPKTEVKVEPKVVVDKPLPKEKPVPKKRNKK